MVGFKWAAAALFSTALATPTARNYPTKVPGKAFDRIAIVWFENTDYDKAIGDPNFAALAKQGITLSNYYGLTHPSQPNYIGSIAGEYFGMNHDDVTDAASNVSTVIDLLEDRGISWAEYQEDMPSTGFTGKEYLNQQTHANDYVRKHNPAVSYLSVSKRQDRLAKTKNLTLFQQDLKNNALPQWMFITPNMTSDGHDTSVTVAGQWAKDNIVPLLNNKNFMQRTLVLLTWDENHTYTQTNRILGILLGDAVPENLRGTTDDTYYNHYSEMSTVQANWGLHTLGRWDVGANVYKVVAQKTGDKQRSFPEATSQDHTYFFNESYAGVFNEGNNSVPYPVPNTKAKYAGRTVLPSVVRTWGAQNNTIYDTGVKNPDGLNPPKGY